MVVGQTFSSKGRELTGMRYKIFIKIRERLQAVLSLSKSAIAAPEMSLATSAMLHRSFEVNTTPSRKKRLASTASSDQDVDKRAKLRKILAAAQETLNGQ